MKADDAYVLNDKKISESLSGISSFTPTPDGFNIISGGNTYSFTIPNMHTHSNLADVLNLLTTNANGDLFFKGKQLSNGSVTNLYELTATAGSGGVAKNKIVYLSDSDTVMTASSNNQTHCNKVLGICLDTVVSGDITRIQNGGEVINDQWALTPGDSYFLGLGGEITNVPPKIGFIQKIGIAKNPTTLIVTLKQPIKII